MILHHCKYQHGDSKPVAASISPKKQGLETLVAAVAAVASASMSFLVGKVGPVIRAVLLRSRGPERHSHPLTQLHSNHVYRTLSVKALSDRHHCSLIEIGCMRRISYFVIF